MLGIISITILSAILIAIALFVYYLVYRHSINKKILSGEVTGRKMADIPKMIMIGIIVFLLVVSLINFYAFSDTLKKTQENSNSRDSLGVIDVSDKSNYKLKYYAQGTNPADEDFNADFAYIYSEDENSGYNRNVEKKGGFTFTIFTRNGPADNFHPDFLCFVEYSGENNNSITNYINVDFIDNKNSKSTNGTGFDSNEKKLLYIGNLNKEETFKITVSILDEQAQDKFDKDTQEAYKKDPKSSDEFPKIEDYAISSESVSINISD